MVAGQLVDIGSSTTLRIISALRLPGTDAMIFWTRRSAGTVRVMADLGTSSRLLNQPSATCCCWVTLIQLNDLYIEWIVKVRLGRIVKRQMPVLPNPRQTQLRFCGTQLFRIVPAGKLRVGRIAIDPKKLFHRHVLGQMLAKKIEE